MFGDVSFSTEGIVVISALLAVLAGTIGKLFLMLSNLHAERLANQEAIYKSQLTDLSSQRNSYREMADEAVKALEDDVNRLRRKDGRRPIAAVAPVVAEHDSPVTPEQQATADMQTLRAKLTAATLELGLPAREAARPETEEEKYAREWRALHPEPPPVE